MLKRYPVIAGAIFGVLLRLIFSGRGGSPWSAMAGAFIYITPIVVGMLTVYLAERDRRRNWHYYILAALRIGVPMPMSGTTRLTPDGMVRESRWGKRVHFEEIIQDWQPERYVRWTYRFAPDSFPPDALDDHVVIGGHYFDVFDTSFTLVPECDATRLSTQVHYRISTQFNFYAAWVAQLLLGNLSEMGLRLYKSRSEREWITRVNMDRQ